MNFSTEGIVLCVRKKHLCFHFRFSATGNEEVLNQVDLPILDDSVCQSEFPVFLADTEVCAGYKDQGKDWCAVRIIFDCIY